MSDNQHSMSIIDANGARIPSLGLGTYRMDADEVKEIVPAALRLGFRHVDTAQIYDNEAAVGSAIVASGVDRDEVFLTTKVWVSEFAPDRFEASVAESLRKLKTDHVDLLLLHWPFGSDVPRHVQIELLNAVKANGMTRHIGVSNYTTALMREAAALSEAPLVANQIEYHPWLDQSAVVAQARELGMSITSYYAMADGRSPTDPTLAAIGESHGKTAAQVALRWLLQQDGVGALTKTSKLERLPENFELFDFELTDEEMDRIFAMHSPDGRIVSPEPLMPEWD